MRDHRKLRAFELADELVLKIYAATKTFPNEEQFWLTSQIRKSAVSIASNIIEGCARHSQADYVRFLDMAFGSVREVQYQLSIAEPLGYLPERASVEAHRSSRRDRQRPCRLKNSLRRADEPHASGLRPQAYLYYHPVARTLHGPRKRSAAPPLRQRGHIAGQKVQ
jgi:four helix bundle protein